MMVKTRRGWRAEVLGRIVRNPRAFRAGIFRRKLRLRSVLWIHRFRCRGRNLCIEFIELEFWGGPRYENRFLVDRDAVELAARFDTSYYVPDTVIEREVSYEKLQYFWDSCARAPSS